MTKQLYTIATAELELLDIESLTTLEAAEAIRDDMEKILNRQYHVVNLKTFCTKD